MKASKYFNFLITIILCGLVIYFDSFQKISTQLEAILPNGAKKEFLEEFNKFKSTKKIFLSVKGLDNNSLQKIKFLEKSLTQIEGLSLESFKSNQSLEKYKRDYAFFINDFNAQALEELNIKQQLSHLKTKIMNSDFSYFIDKQDPLELLEKKSQKSTLLFKNGHMVIENYGYLSILTLDKSINSFKQYETIYDAIHTITSSQENIHIFSPIFYFVENSRIIKDDVNKIILFSTFVMLLLYWVVLKNLFLLLNTIATLFSSILLALFFSSFLFDEISIFVIVFGVSVSTVAIDYMFHHYVHNYYEKNMGSWISIR